MEGEVQAARCARHVRSPPLPTGWCWASLPQLGELNRGKSKHRPRNDPRLLGGPYPFIQTGDVRHSEGFITGHTASYFEFGLAQSRLWPAGTLCITIAANIADTGILKFDACFPDSVVGFLNHTEALLVRFVELFIRTAKEGLDRYAPATAQKNINLNVLASVAVPLPPFAEQARIVAEVDRLLSVGGSAEHVASVNVSRAARLRQSILKWAFKGKLVDQDPDDESASVLLERVKAERDNSAPDEESQARTPQGGSSDGMSDTADRIVQKLWSYCNVLRDDGLSYQDYLEQLTFLLFLKMADERAQLTGEEQPIPEGYRWADLAAPQMEGVELEQHYRHTLSELGQQGGMLGLIFEKAQNKIQDPAKLRQLIVELIGKENWSAMSADVKGDAYEGLLEKNAQDVKGGAGQYFTPRSVIEAIVDCVQPQPGEIVVDPACGIGGFLLATHEYLKTHNELAVRGKSLSC